MSTPANNDILDDLETAFQIAGIVSACCSLLVIITSLSIETSDKLRRKIFMQMIITISACDTIGSIGTALGFQSSGSIGCNFQTVSATMFYEGSWLWTLALTFLLYRLITTGKIAFHMYQCHLVIWPIALLSTLLPLTTNRYGNIDDQTASWCYLSGNEETAQIWFYASYASVLVFSILIMMGFVIHLVFMGKFSSMPADSVHSKGISSAMHAIVFYPLGLFLVWFPSIVAFLFFSDSSNPYVFVVTSVIAACNGIVLSFIYFYRMPKARRFLAVQFSRLFCCFEVVGYGVSTDASGSERDGGGRSSNAHQDMIEKLRQSTSSSIMTEDEEDDEDQIEDYVRSDGSSKTAGGQNTALHSSDMRHGSSITHASNNVTVGGPLSLSEPSNPSEASVSPSYMTTSIGRASSGRSTFGVDARHFSKSRDDGELNNIDL
jgi:Slime mold cyclic AMP receptor